MSASDAVRKWLGRWAKQSGAVPQNRPLTRNPALENLEERAVPTVYLVNTTRDGVDTDGLITLREAVLAANTGQQVGDALPGTGVDTIQFDASLAGETIALQITGDNSFGATALAVTRNLTINGQAVGALQAVTIGNDSAFGDRRIFLVGQGATLNLTDVIIKGGTAVGANGFDGVNGGGGGGGGAGMGGGVLNQGTLNVQRSTFTENQAIGGRGGNGGTNPSSSLNTLGGAGGGTQGGAGGSPNVAGKPGGFASGGGGGGGRGATATGGGGFSSTNGLGGGAGGGPASVSTSDPDYGGRLVVYGGRGGQGTTLTGGAGGGGAGLGGAIFNLGGSVSVVNSTFGLNAARGGEPGAGGINAAAGLGLGGAVFSQNGFLRIDNSTLAQNTGNQGGAVFAQADGTSATAVLNSSIFAQSGGVSDVVGRNLNGGSLNGSGVANLIQNLEPGAFPTSMVATSQDPQLTILTENGGPTPTYALRPGSAAANAGANVLFLSTDQRGQGYPRVLGGAIDIGAFELADATVPRVLSMVRSNPASQSTNAAEVTFLVTFDQPVSQVNAGSFALVGTGLSNASVTSVEPVGGTVPAAAYRVKVKTGGDGSLGLSQIQPTTIVNALGNKVSGIATGEFYTVNRTAPSVVGINLLDANPTNASTLRFMVVFSKDILKSTIGVNNFTLNLSGVNATIQSVTPSNPADTASSTYIVTVGVSSGSGRVALDLSNAGGITDTLGNPLQGAFFSSTGYDFDSTSPIVQSLLALNGGQVNPDGSMDFEIKFNKPVDRSTVTPSVINLSFTGTLGAAKGSVTGAEDTYRFRVNGVSGSGTIKVTIPNNAPIFDTLGNPLAAGGEATVSGVNRNTPSVRSITPSVTTPTRGPDLTFEVLFSKPIQSATVNAADFVLIGDGQSVGRVVSVTPDSVNPALYRVLVSGLAGQGRLGLDISPAAIIIDTQGFPVPTGFSDGQLAIVDTVGPLVFTVVPLDSNPTNQTTLRYSVTFDKQLDGATVTPAGFTLVQPSGGTWVVTQVVADPLKNNTYIVTVQASGAIGNGDLYLVVPTSGSIRDLAGNPLARTYNQGQPYRVTSISPAVESVGILDANPTKASLVGYLVTFTQDVDPTTVNPEDFLLISQPLPGQTVGYARGVVSSITGTGNQFQIYVTITDGDGRLRLEVAPGADIRNLAGEKLNTSGLMPGASYDILYQPPTVVDAIAQPPAKSGAPTVAFLVTFSAPMNPQTVTAQNFQVIATGLTGTPVVSGVIPVPGSDNVVFQVNITGYSGRGTLELNVLGGMGAQDAAGNPMLVGLPPRSVYTIDTIAAQTLSIAPVEPGTNQSTMDFVIRFNQPIDPATITASSFQLVTTGTAQGTIKILPPTPPLPPGLPSYPYVFQVENISGTGTITANLAPNSGILDTFGNAVNPTGFAGSPLQVIAPTNLPTVSSIITTSPNPLFSNTAQFKITFSQNMDPATITPAELALVMPPTLQGVITQITGSGTEFTVTVENITGVGTLQLIVPNQTTIADIAGNILASGFLAGPSYSVNTISPVVKEITQLNPALNNTNASAVGFRVTFGQSINGGLDLASYLPVFSGTLSGAVTSVVVSPTDPNPAQPSIFDVTVSTSGSGTVELRVPANAPITSLNGTPFSVAFDAGQTYNIDNQVPTVSFTDPAITTPVSTTQLLYTLQFSEPVLIQTVQASALNLIIQGSLSGSIGTIQALDPADGSASRYQVQVIALVGTGTASLGVVANSGIADRFGNVLTQAFTAGVPATINQVAPKAVSIVATGPVVDGSVSFRVLFDKAVNPLTVNPSDFDVVGNVGGAISDIHPDDSTNTTMLVTISGLSGFGTVRLNLRADATIRDFAGNLIVQQGLTGPEVTVNNIAPGVRSISRLVNQTNAASASFLVVFTQPMNLASVTPSSFLIQTTGSLSGSVTSVQPNGAVTDSVIVTVSNLSGAGQLSLGVRNDSPIVNTLGVPLANGYDPSISTPISIDRVGPTVVAINRGGDLVNDPSRSNGELAFLVSFSEPVDPATVRLTAFQLSFTGATTGVLQSVVPFGDSFLVLARGVSGAGTIKLDLLPNSGIRDNFGNVLNAGFTQGQSYQIQGFNPQPTPAPQIVSIDIESALPTRATRLRFEVNFNRDMIASTVTPSAFQLVATGGVSGSITSVTGTGKTYFVTVEGVSGTGTLALQTVQNPGILDLALQPLPGGFTSGFAYQVDNTAPTINRLILLSPNPTRDTSVLFQVEFSEPVDPKTVTSEGVLIGYGGSAQISSIVQIDAEGRLFQIQVDNIEGAGELSLFAPTFGTFPVKDLAGNLIVGGAGFPGYEVDRVDPLVSSITLLDGNPTGAGSVRYLVQFTEVVVASSVTVDDFLLVAGGSASGVVRSVQGSGSTYIITVDSIAGSGTLALQVPSTANIIDLLENPLGSGFQASETYTVNRTAPAVTFFAPTETAVPAGQAIVFQLVFNTDINPATLVPSVFLVNTTGGAAGTVQSINGSGRQFTVTVAPSGTNGTIALEIPAFSGVQDTLGNEIAVPAQSDFTDYLPVAATVVSLDPLGSSIQGGLDPTDPTQTIRYVKFQAVFSQPMDPASLTADSVVINNTGQAVTGFGNVTWVNDRTAVIALQIVNGVGSVNITILPNGFIEDAAGNPLAAGATSPSVLLDITPPSVEEIIANGPPFATNSGTVQFTVRFSESMPASAIPTPNGDYANYPIQTIVTGNLIANVIAVAKDTVDPSVFLITVGGGFDTLGQAIPMSGTGFLSLKIPDGAAIFDEAGNELNRGGTSNRAFFVDRTNPAINEIEPEGSVLQGGPAVPFLVQLNKPIPIANIKGSDFIFTQTGTFDPGIVVDAVVESVDEIAGEASLYRVFLINVNGIGTLQLGISPTAVIKDALGNELDTGATFPSVAADVNSTVPTMESVTLLTPVPSPTNVTQLQFDVVFTQGVFVGTATQLATSDFVTIDLNGGTARGSVTSVSGSGRNYRITVTSVSGTGLLSIGLAPLGYVRSAYGVPAQLGTPSPQDAADVDRVAPAVETINLEAGGSSVNGSLTNTWKVVFSKEVNASTVNPSDFRLITTGTLVAEIVNVVGDKDTYSVTVRNITGDGTISLAVPQGVSIFDLAGNRLAGEFTAGQIATTDRVAPRVDLILPLTQSPVNGGLVYYEVIFSKPVDPATVIPGIFTLTTTGTARGQVVAAQPLAGNPLSYLVTVTDIGGNGTIRLDLPSGSPVEDQAGNRLANGFDATPTIDVDTSAPKTVSITGSNPSPTAASGVGFVVTFDSPVRFSSLTPEDFEVFGTSSAAGVVSAITPIDTQGRIYGVQVAGISGEGILSLRIRPTARITDPAGNLISGGFSSGFEYTVDRVAPAVSGITGPAGNQLYTSTATFNVAFSEAVNPATVNTADFVLALSNATGTISSVTPVVGTNNQFTVNVTGISGNGSLRLDVPSTATITDPLGNNLAGGFSLATLYGVRTNAPTVASFTTRVPTTQIIKTSAADFQIVFSKPVKISTVTSSAFSIASVGGITGTVLAPVPLDGAADLATTFRVTLGSINGSGNIGLNVVAGRIQDAFGNFLISPATSPLLSIDNQAPQIVGINLLDITPTSATQVRFRVLFSENVIPETVLPTSFQLVTTGFGTQPTLATLTRVNDSSFDVLVNGISRTGTIALRLLPNSGISDRFGNIQNGTFTGSTIYNIRNAPTSTAPRVSSITNPATGPIKATSTTFTVNFDSAVQGVTAASFTPNLSGGFTGATIGTITQVTPSSYTVVVENLPAGAYNLRLDIAANPGITNLGGQALITPYGAGVTVLVRNAPVTATTSVDSNLPTNGGASGSVVYRLVFANPVEVASVVNNLAANFGLTSVTGNAAGVVSAASGVNAVGGLATEFAVTVNSLSGTGFLRLDIKAGNAILDQVGNSAAPYNSGASYNIDKTPPAVSKIESLSGTVSASNQITWRVTFTKPVQPETVTANSFFLVENGQARGELASISGSGAVYQITANATEGAGSLALAVVVPSSGVRITDLVGNTLAQESTGPAVVVDFTPPTVLGVALNGPSSVSRGLVNFTLGFTKDMQASTVTTQALKLVTNSVSATITSVTPTQGNTPIFTVGANITGGSGFLGLDALPGRARDVGGNPLVATNPNGMDYLVSATTPQVANIDIQGPQVTRLASLDFIVNFTLPMDPKTITANGFEIRRTGTATGSIGSVVPLDSDSTSFRVTLFNVTGNGELGLSVRSGSQFRDQFGNQIGNATFPSISYTIDNIAPRPTGITIVGANLTNATSVQFDVAFNEPISAESLIPAAYQLVTTGNLIGRIASVTGLLGNPLVYRVTVDKLFGEGTVAIQVLGNGLTADLAGNTFVGSPVTGPSITITSQPPQVTAINLVPPTSTNATSVQFQVVFNQAMDPASFQTSDFLATFGGSLTGQVVSVTGSGTAYLVTVANLAGDGTVNLSVPTTATLTDLAGNPIEQGFGPSADFRVDLVPPVITQFQSTQGLNPTTKLVPFQVSFSEVVTGFTAASISTTNGTIVNFKSVDGKTYTFDNQVAIQGPVKVTISPTGIKDTFGNALVAGASRTVTYAPPLPTVAGLSVGGLPFVQVIEPNGSTRQFQVFGTNFRGGLSVATGDVNGDGFSDIIAAVASNGPSHVKVFSGRTNQVLYSFFAFAPEFVGGVNVAAGDINADGFADIIVGSGFGARPHIKVFSGQNGGAIRSFFAYDAGFAGGVRVASGDVNGDGFSDIVTGSGAGTRGHIKVFSGQGNNLLQNFFAYGPTVTTGVFVASGDLDGNGLAEVVVSLDRGSLPAVRVFAGPVMGTPRQEFLAFNSPFRGGSRIAVVNRAGSDGLFLVAGNGPGAPSQLRYFNGASTALVDSMFVLSNFGFTGGIDV